ncbi:MAG: radical SAM protein [Asgard group archaeon]|nr:radical SAM protein [Asgard group archaeon]
MTKMHIEEIHAKSIIRQGGPSIFSWSEVYLNPYQGCYHDCVYCDGKSENYHMHDDFGHLIKVKINAPQLLVKFLQGKGFFPVHKKEQMAMYDYFPSLKDSSGSKLSKWIITPGGGVCDAYQQAEETVKMTRKLLEILYDYQFPVWILTKNDLVLRDIDLLKKINEESYACVSFTITHNDEKVQKIFEPRASTTNKRFEAIRELRKAGIHSGIYCYPALPFIGDTDENIQAIYKRAKEVGAEFIYANGLTLKPGRSKNEFMETLKQYDPEIYSKYIHLYGNENKYGNLDIEQFKRYKLKHPLLTGYKYGYELGIDYCAKRYPPEGQIETNVHLAEILHRISYIKNNIIRTPLYEINAFSKATRMVETSKRDFGLLEKEDYEDIPTTKLVREVIIDYLEKKKSKYLLDLEKEAYERIVAKYYS